AVGEQRYLAHAEVARPAALPRLQARAGGNDEIQPVARFAPHVVAPGGVHGRTAQRADAQEGMLAAFELVDEVVAVERLEVGGKPVARIFFAPLLVVPPGGPSCVPAVEHCSRTSRP